MLVMNPGFFVYTAKVIITIDKIKNIAIYAYWGLLGLIGTKKRDQSEITP
jgi:hypothetical protein